MKNNKPSKEHFESFRKLCDALVPPVEDMNDDELADMLSSSGIDSEVVIEKAYKHLQGLAGRRFISQSKNVPLELRNAVHQLKPISLADKATAEIGKARIAIRSILETMKETTTGLAGSVLAPSLQPAFRNKKELTETDREQLAKLQDELDRVDAAQQKHRPEPE